MRVRLDLFDMEREHTQIHFIFENGILTARNEIFSPVWESQSSCDPAAAIVHSAACGAFLDVTSADACRLGSSLETTYSIRRLAFG